MKYPKYKLAFPGKHVIVFKGHPMTQFGGYTLGTYASGNGIVSANKTKGFWGESAELFQSASDYYTFNGYSANKGTVNGNTYIFGKGNDIVTAFFNETEIYNLFLNQTQGGTITGIPMSGHSGQYIVLSALPSAHYTFNGYSVTGGVLSGDKIIIGNSDMTAQANWIQDPVRNIVLVQVSGGEISSDKATAYDGDIVLFSYTPSANYVFNGYDITGSVLSGNSALVNNSNITAKGKFLYNDPGEDYESVDICNQTWMKYNLNVDDGRGGVVKSHSCYGGYDFGEQYFYTTEAAYRIGNSIRGWRVPSWGDVTALQSCAGGRSAGYNLKSTFGWYKQNVLSQPPGNGCDKYGFRALPVGNYVHNIVNDTYYLGGVGCATTFICGPSSFETPAWWWTFQGDNDQMGFVNNGYKYSNLRLIKKPKHTITLNQTSGGVIMANMLTAYSDDEIVLTNQSLPGWAFANYSVTGATLTGNRFIMPENDVTAQGNFIEHPERQLFVQQTNGGTVWGSTEYGFDGDVVTLNKTPSAGYSFSSFNITGATLTGDKFTFNGSNVTAKGNFYLTPPSPLVQVHSAMNDVVGNSKKLNSNKKVMDTPTAINYNGYSAGSSGALRPDVFYGLNGYNAIHFRFKNNPIDLNNTYYFGCTISAHAGEDFWKNNKWVTDCNSYNGNIIFSDHALASTYEYTKLSANRLPLFTLYYANSSFVNTAYGEQIGSTIYAKADNWSNIENDIKYVVGIKPGSNTDANYDRTYFVSAYYNDNFIGSAWQGLYAHYVNRCFASYGLWSATNTANINKLVAGSSRLDMGNFANSNDAKRWLDFYYKVP